MAVSNVIPRLRREHPAVKPFLRHQLLMGAALRHAAVFKHRHAVAELTGGQSVGDKQRGLVLHELIQMGSSAAVGSSITTMGESL